MRRRREWTRVDQNLGTESEKGAGISEKLCFSWGYAGQGGAGKG